MSSTYVGTNLNPTTTTNINVDETEYKCSDNELIQQVINDERDKDAVRAPDARNWFLKTMIESYADDNYMNMNMNMNDWERRMYSSPFVSTFSSKMVCKRMSEGMCKLTANNPTVNISADMVTILERFIATNIPKPNDVYDDAISCIDLNDGLAFYDSFIQMTRPAYVIFGSVAYNSYGLFRSTMGKIFIIEVYVQEILSYIEITNRQWFFNSF